MKNLLILIIATLALGACTTARDYKQISKQLAEPGLSVIEDTANNTLCYIYKDDDDDVVVSMQCTKKDQFKGLKVNATISN